MKIIQTYFYTILLIAMFLSGWWIWETFITEKVVSGESNVKISAAEIEKILEMNGAKQIIKVRFDTTYTDIAYRIKLGAIGLSSYSRKNTSTELRTWEVKSGSSSFNIVDNELFIQEPGITSCEELNTKREIEIKGEWSPIAVKAIAIKSKSLAKKTAEKKGITDVAKFNIEEAFSRFKINVVWIK